MKTKNEKIVEDSTIRDSRNWKGMFYKNRRDYRIIVPKKNPAMGWTLNFANPYSYILLIAIILIVLLFSLFME
jgi:Predicted membrane protein